jgi:parallel beta-helix repeat protein
MSITFKDGSWYDGESLIDTGEITLGEVTYVLVDQNKQGYQSIQEAVAAAPEGATILVAAGDYSGTVLINKQVTLQAAGTGEDAPVLDGAIHVLADDVTIDGFTIENGAAFTGAGPAAILVQANGTIIKNNVLNGSDSSIDDAVRGVEVTAGAGQDLTISGNTMKGWATGIFANDGVSGTVSGNTLVENNVGMSADGPHALKIGGNTFTNNITEQLAFGVTGETFNVTNYLTAANTFTGTAPKVSVWDISDKSQTLTGSNEADAIHGGDGADTAAGYPTGAVLGQDEGGNWTVTVGGVVDVLTGIEKVVIGGKTHILVDDNGDGFSETIQAAVDAAAEGDVIVVAAGIYTETVTITKDVTIKGAKAGIAGASESRAEGNGETVLKGGIHILANGVTIDGFSIENGSVFNGAGEAGILVQANSVTLQNNILRDIDTNLQDGSRGVLVATGNGEDLTVSNNVMKGWSTGIYTDAGTSGTVSGNLLTGNYVGMSADGPGALEIAGNTFTDNTFEQLAFGVTAESFNVTDYLTGSKFNGTAPEVSVYGLSNDGHTITGSQYDDAIYGGKGDDVLIGGGGEDAINGGDGVDMAAGYPAGAVLGHKDGKWTVTVSGVVEVLTGIEKVQIGGKTYILVDVNGDGFSNTIQDAIDAANDGEIIMVAAGTYTETVVVNKDVTILGANAGVGGYGRLNSSLGAAETTITGGIQILKDGVTLDGLKIEAGNFVGDSAGAFVQAANVTISNSVFMGDGVPFSGRAIVTDASAKGLTITDNYMSGWATGAYLNPGTTGTVTGNVLSGNNVGISMDDPAGLSVSGNILFGNKFENIGVGVSTGPVDVSPILGANTILSSVPGGDVSFYGLGSGQTFQGTVYADTFHGTAEADVFAGGAGDDVIKGGAGNDTVVFSGKRSDYAVSFDHEGKVTITDLRGNGGTGSDIVSDVESFKFANGTISRETLVDNDAPTAVSLSGDRRVLENAANGTVIGALSATDADADDILTYELADSAGGRFAILDGKLVVANGSLLDYEKGTSHLVKVKVTDFSGESFVQDLTIAVGNVNEAPTDITVSGGSVLENSANGTEVASLSGVDQDAGDTFSFSLLDNAGGRFVIGGANGDKILVADSFKLDYEQATSHQVVVRVTDKSGASYNETLTLAVADVRTETVSGSSGSDQISGGSGKDVLNGGAGNDQIIGGVGKDTLTGGSGKDVFVFGNKDTGTSKGTADYITDFSGKGGDKIDLKLIDADTKKKGDQAFSFIGKEAFTKAGQVRYEKAGKDTYVYLNTDSDKSAESVIKLKGAFDLQKGWFVL